MLRIKFCESVVNSSSNVQQKLLVGRSVEACESDWIGLLIEKVRLFGDRAVFRHGIYRTAVSASTYVEWKEPLTIRPHQ